MKQYKRQDYQSMQLLSSSLPPFFGKKGKLEVKFE
jgi:hypothetical protein